jgi:hypothetical protein
MKNPGVIVLSLVSWVVSLPVRAGHEAPLYPSFYPQEIRVEAVDPAAAVRLLETSKIHAYVGRAPDFAGPAPKSVRFVESLGSYLVVRVNPASPAAKDGPAACAVARRVLKTIAADPGRIVLHPYPINGYHADYLHHADLAEAAKARLLDGPATDATGLTLRVEGALAHEPPPPWRARAGNPDWDASVEEVDAAKLVAGQSFSMNGWLGPPWLKAGWFHAYLLLAPALGAPAREQAAALFARLRTGPFISSAERINVERDLVAQLTTGCTAVVAGYTAKREYYSAQYSDGIENIAWDSHAGLNSAIFIRAVKLKDFPWNGWLHLGVPAPPSAAWNPFAGFTDEAGRLIWSAIGDPALFPEPYGAGWTLNRIGDVLPAASR